MNKPCIINRFLWIILDSLQYLFYDLIMYIFFCFSIFWPAKKDISEKKTNLSQLVIPQGVSQHSDAFITRYY